MTDPVRDPCVVVAVPARLESARLPGKLLADIAGKPMLQHVLERCRQARGVAAVVVCTDSDQVRAGAAAWGFPVLMTSASCRSGSERLASVVEELVAAAGGLPTETLVINVQGDQPLLDPGIIEAMVPWLRCTRRFTVSPLKGFASGTSAAISRVLARRLSARHAR